VSSDVAAAVVHTANGLDAEVSVAPRLVAGQLRRPALDVEAIPSCADGEVALQATMTILPSDQERVRAAAPDEVSADKVVMAADRRPIEGEVDPVPVRADDVVAGDYIAVSFFDRDAVPAFRDAVSGDHVSRAGANEDAGRVSSAAVAPDLVAVGLEAVPPQEDSGAVPREHAPLDQVLVGVGNVDPRPWVVTDLVVHDPNVVRPEQADPVSLRGDVAAGRTVSDHASGNTKEPDPEEVVL